MKEVTAFKSTALRKTSPAKVERVKTRSAGASQAHRRPAHEASNRAVQSEPNFLNLRRMNEVAMTPRPAIR